MEWEGKVGSPQLICAANGRALQPGETVYGLLIQREGRFERLDIAAEAWEGYDRSAALSWWKRTVPEPDRRPNRVRLDPAALGRIFADLADASDPQPVAFRYVVALCLVRARRMLMEKVERDADGTWMILLEKGTGGARHRLRDPVLKPEDEAALTDQLLAVAQQG